MPYSSLDSAVDFTPLTRDYVASEAGLLKRLIAETGLSPASDRWVHDTAKSFARDLLSDAESPSVVDSFLNEYTLSSSEGILLMRLAESLVRTPDSHTASLLLRDKISAGRWLPHTKARSLLVKLGTLGLSLSKGWIQLSGGPNATHALARIGDRSLLFAVRRAIGLLGRHFVLGKTITDATRRAKSGSEAGTTYSYDMLGEAALTEQDAAKYFTAYRTALEFLAKASSSQQSLHESPALSVKLSALHPRYEYGQRDRCVPVLAERITELCRLAKSANLGLTIDAEEVERLEISLLVFERVLSSEDLRGWDGFGLAIQAYQKRASSAVDWVIEAAKRHHQRVTVRLVKGAYWDREIKRAQELGLENYPVFTRKENTDVSYLACARKLLDAAGWIYPQFATHNAQTAAAIIHMAGERRTFEFQRLHGMSDGLHRRLAKDFGFSTRTYAPVGRHKDLLPYLVRRLLENGANASFVNQVNATNADLNTLVENPIARAAAQDYAPHPALMTPRQRRGSKRPVAGGVDLTQSKIALKHELTEVPSFVSPNNHQRSITEMMDTAARSEWPNLRTSERAEILRKAGDLLERDGYALKALCVHEAGKSWHDAEAELREAVDFLRYYADQIQTTNVQDRAALGTVACISPWNFPLAIFLGQVSAALSVGNTVIAKPAEQTPLIAIEALKRLYKAGIPRDAVQLILGDGKVGAALIAQTEIKAVCFTGSTGTAKNIARALADTDRGDVPLIAETGGINAMVIDSTALLEQAVKDVIASAFQSAGQRCSACRLVCVQSDIADSFIKMLRGAMDTLRVADPSQLSTDLGPLIDSPSHERVAAHIENFTKRFKIIGEAPNPTETEGQYLSPVVFELNAVSDLSEEVFGPVLHLVRFRARNLDTTIQQINALGYGLTMGLHSRIDKRIERVSETATVGNLYVNRNQIGAVVGEQPFGGEGLSGTGPKAGGPNYLKRLSRPTSLNTENALPSKLSIPSPTGETNELSYVPRGLLLCLGGDQKNDLLAQQTRVRETGNQVALLMDEPLSKALANPALKGVVAEGQMRRDVAAFIAQRDGPILPLLSAADERERYFVERVVTIDTTAAGGNAQLLAEI